MLKRIWNSRELKKFCRNKTAVLSLLVILLYLATAIAVMCGAVTKEDCRQVIASRSLPGFYHQQVPEKRYNSAVADIFAKTQRALGKKNVETALYEIELGAYRVRLKREEDKKDKVEGAKEEEAETEEAETEEEETEEEQAEAEEQAQEQRPLDTAAGEKTIEELQQIVDEANAILKEIEPCPNLDEDPSMMPTLVRLEEKVNELIIPLTPKQEFTRNLGLCLGTDSQGRSIFFRAVYSVKIALQIGLVTAAISVLLGAFLGAIAGYFGGWVDHLIVWIYTTFSSIPGLVLLVVIAYAFSDSSVEIPFTTGGNGSDGKVLIKDSLFPVYIAFCATFWIGTCRVIRGETMKLRQLEYVQAARTSGFGSLYILIRHVLPNTAHLMLINFSLLLIGAIKSEVILSYLGLGVKSQPSWGIMIKDANTNSEVMNGFFWQIGTATVFMFVLVLAFNILSDALQDALDPKHL